MKRYTFRDNLVSAVIGIVIGLPIALHPQPIEAQAAEEPVEELHALNPEPAEEISQNVFDPDPVEIQVYEMTEEDLKEEEFYDDLEILAALVHAEAGNQDMVGKRLVVDVVLNRYENPAYPDTLEGVIFQLHQFTPTENGALEKSYSQITEADYEAVRLELGERLDPEIYYFGANGYSQYGLDAYKHGDHYFSYRK